LQVSRPHEKDAVSNLPKGKGLPNTEAYRKNIEAFEEITARAPKQVDGKVDYNALPDQSPEDFAVLREDKTSPEAAKKEFERIYTIEAVDVEGQKKSSAGQLTVAKQNASEQVPIADDIYSTGQLVGDNQNDNRQTPIAEFNTKIQKITIKKVSKPSPTKRPSGGRKRGG